MIMNISLLHNHKALFYIKLKDIDNFATFLESSVFKYKKSCKNCSNVTIFEFVFNIFVCETRTEL